MLECIKNIKKIVLRHELKLVALLLLIVLTSCQSKADKELTFPDSSKIVSISIEEIPAGNSDTYSGNIDQLVNAIKSDSHLSKVESVNDAPLNVDEYIKLTIKTNKSDNDQVHYVYTRDGEYFIEKPYDGIWNIGESAYNMILDDLHR